MSSLDMFYALDRHKEFEMRDVEHAVLPVARHMDGGWWVRSLERVGDLLIVSGMKLKRQSAARPLSLQAR